MGKSASIPLDICYAAKAGVAGKPMDFRCLKNSAASRSVLKCR
jgi:hypothetical protein